MTAIKAIGTMTEKKGYAGTAIFTKEKPKDVFYGINEPFYDNEGRVINARIRKLFLSNLLHTEFSKRTQKA